ncbi:MAG: DUF3618 domain-containing protein [Propionibacteriaceae bacterium]|jgi:hypothetical protein|nr:DUF3618 domain-containing protein [Propionibacteriaceae bacterium]
MGERSPEQIKAEIVAARERLAQGVQGLVSEVHPAAIRATAVDAVKAGVDAQVAKVKALVVDSAGIRWDRIGTAVIVAVGALGICGVLKGMGRLLRRY